MSGATQPVIKFRTTAYYKTKLVDHLNKLCNNGLVEDVNVSEYTKEAIKEKMARDSLLLKDVV